MLTPTFWWRRIGPTALLLAPIGLIYGAIAGLRMGRDKGAEPPLPLVCVGNFVAGGAGKTPTVIRLAEIARANGLDPCFLTRGYGGKKRGPLLVNLDRHSDRDVGDEALLLARTAPTVVSRSRAAAFALLKGLGADICFMDDGFQSPGVRKTFSLVVIDGAVGTGNGLPMPAGPLRAPLGRQMRHADALLIFGDTTRARKTIRRAARAGKPVFHADLVADDLPVPRSRKLFAFAGIGRPEKFFRSLEAEGYQIAARRAFADHHRYRPGEFTALLDEADALDAVPVTTAKDAVRLPRGTDGSNWSRERVKVFGVRARLAEEQAVATLLADIRKRWMARHYS